MPKFFGFEGIGILFRDTKTDKLFSIQQDDQPGDREQIEKKKLKSINKQLLSDKEAM